MSTITGGGERPPMRNRLAFAHAVTRAIETFNVTRQEAQAQVRVGDPR